MEKFKYFALKYISDGNKTYIPGDEITSGRVYEEREYYVNIGTLEKRSVNIVRKKGKIKK